jgi:hypothetical protein
VKGGTVGTGSSSRGGPEKPPDSTEFVSDISEKRMGLTYFGILGRA